MAAEHTEKARNAARIVRTIWKNPLISRFEIADRLGLERSTITHQVSRLLKSGLVNEIAEGRAGPNGGRKPIHLAINKDYGYIIGIEMQYEAYSVVGVNLAGDILRFKKVPRALVPESFIDDVLTIARSFSEELGGPEHLLGVGVGVSGIIDSERGIIKFSIPLKLAGSLEFSQSIAERSDIPFLIDNDANCCAWGELAFHRVNGFKNFLFCLVQFRSAMESLEDSGGVGVGFGVVIDGKVFTGVDFTAGEFRSAFWDGPERSQFSLSPRELGRITTGDDVMRRFAVELSKNVALLVNTLDLNKVFIGGDVENYCQDFPVILQNEIRRNWMYSMESHCEVSYSSMGEKTVAYGAAGMLLHRIFTSSHLYVEEETDADPLVRVLKL